MKRSVLLLFLAFFIQTAQAGTLYLTNFSGEAGPAPAPAPYTTSLLMMQNGPQVIDEFQFRIHFYFNDLVLANMYWMPEVLDGWQIDAITTCSGAECYKTYYAWTVSNPLPANMRVSLAEVNWQVKTNTDHYLALTDLAYDFSGWEAKGAQFTYVSSRVFPHAEAGPDQVVYDAVTFDGSGSYIENGSILTYTWEISYRGGQTIYASGVKPVLEGLSPGWYDVVLTVMEPGGLSDTDSMELAASGPPGGVAGDANKDGKAGMEDVGRLLQTLTGY